MWFIHHIYKNLILNQGCSQKFNNNENIHVDNNELSITRGNLVKFQVLFSRILSDILVLATITLKDHSKFTGTIIKGSTQFWNWNINYPRLRIPIGTTPKLLSFWAVILTQGVLTGLVPDNSPNRLLKEKLIGVISEIGKRTNQGPEPTGSVVVYPLP